MRAPNHHQQQLPQRILPLFDALKIPTSKYPFSSTEASRHALNPILVPTTATSFSSSSQSQFIFEQYQYTALGNAVIHRAVSKEVGKFFINRRNTPVAASPNTTKQLIACFHNPLSIRYVAESLPLAPSFDVTNSNDDQNSFPNNNSSSSLNLEEIISNAKPAETSPSRWDKRGTSFDWAPFGFAQSDLAPRLTHFLGCVELFCGREIALEAARRAFFDLDGDHGNIPYEGAQLVATLSKKYNPQNVAKALLAAQGLNSRFLSRSIVVKLKGRRNSTRETSSASGKTQNYSNTNEVDVESKMEHKHHENPSSEISISNSQNNLSSDQHQTINNQSPSKISPSSHVLGPGKLNMIQKWQDKVVKKETSKKQQSHNSVANLYELFGGSGFDNEQQNTTTTAQWPHRTTLPVVQTNADRHGIPDIISQIQYADRKLQGKPVNDPDFHDKQGGKHQNNGVEFTPSELSSVIGVSSERSLSTETNENDFSTSSSNQLSTKAIINTLTQPHDRLFEVSFVRDPIISSTGFRKEVYSTDVPRDSGKGRSIPDLTKGALFDDNNVEEQEAEKKKSKVGPKILSKGIGKSYGEARKAAAMNYLQGVISDLSIL